MRRRLLVGVQPLGALGRADRRRLRLRPLLGVRVVVGQRLPGDQLGIVGGGAQGDGDRRVQLARRRSRSVL